MPATALNYYVPNHGCIPVSVMPHAVLDDCCAEQAWLLLLQARRHPLAVSTNLLWRAWCCNGLPPLHIKSVSTCCRRTGLLMLSRLASTAVTVRLHKQIFFESEATSMATFLWKVRFKVLNPEA